MRKAFQETPDESFSSAKRISARDWQFWRCGLVLAHRSNVVCLWRFPPDSFEGRFDADGDRDMIIQTEMFPARPKTADLVGVQGDFVLKKDQ